MFVYVIRRIVLTVPVLFVIMLITFSLGFYAPGDPLTTFFGEGTEEIQPDPEVVARLRKIYGLDRPFQVQFLDYFVGLGGEGGGLIRGDFGKSLFTKQEIFHTIKTAMPISAQLGAAAFVLLVVLGIPLGIIAAIKQNTWIDYWIIAVSISARSIPVFVLAPMMMIVLVLWLDIMKTPVGWDGIWSQKAILPVFLMATGPLLGKVRLARAGVLEVVGQTYVRTARAKGLRERMVVTRHMLKNSMTPVLTSFGLSVSGMITGALFVELIFGIPGFAGISIQAFQARDYPMILATTLIGSFLTIATNLMVDVGYGFLDPRVRIT